MIEIQSYLGNPDAGFTPVGAYRGQVPDSLYVDGAIEMSVNGTPVLDKTLWDLVDQLWAYIINMVLDLRSADNAHTYFPDQPIDFTLERLKGGRLLISVGQETLGQDRRRASCAEGEFVDAVRTHGTEFFTKLQTLRGPEHDISRYELGRLAAL